MLQKVARTVGMLLLLPSLVLHCAPSELARTSPAVPADSTGTPAAAVADSGQMALRKELEALMRELEEETPLNDPFRDGRLPDLAIVASTDVLGWLTACG